MKIAILGYGKMGHEIEAIANERGHDITIRSCTHKPFRPEDLSGSDVAIEFSQPDAAVNNILKCFDANCPIVVGTTGWYMRLPEVRTEALNRKQAILYSTNFSIGVNVLFHINRELARVMDALNEYEPAIHEIHHIHKLDKPSGTAITLAEGLMENFSRKKKWMNNASVNADELAVTSERTDAVPGTHVVTYDSPVDTLSIRHEAKNRKGFALGAVKAAEWLKGRTGVFSMNDFLKF
ncbi:MAG: dihydrodipicolinate reductase C-terminal domain-containing protein [Flavobacteriales bacterium]|nr:dihydrodipicolinate reductase C-terminal domain-containing protein [Flavobacteriales bacterium]